MLTISRSADQTQRHSNSKYSKSFGSSRITSNATLAWTSSAIEPNAQFMSLKHHIQHQSSKISATLQRILTFHYLVLFRIPLAQNLHQKKSISIVTDSHGKPPWRNSLFGVIH